MNLVREESSRPHVVNPLTVSISSTGKGRLILDLRHVNKHVVYSRIKFEGLETASQYLTPDCYGFVFDLKAAYHNIDIFYNHQKYLGFSWKFGDTVKYFVFTVLPFGLCSAGYIFTKVVRPLVAHWRKDGIKITVYLDDGLGLAENETVCQEQALKVKEDLLSSGFVPNKDKCVWTPVQSLIWLGFQWDLKSCLLKLPLSKIEDFIDLIYTILSTANKLKIRLLARFCGKIISFSPAIGNVTQIMTRSTFSVINLKDDWDQCVDLNQHAGSIKEILFWKENIRGLKPVPIIKSKTDFKVFTDASDTGAAGYLQNSDCIAHRNWSPCEAKKSSTWREVKAVELCIDSFAHALENSSVTFFTDNQNAVSIIKKGSKIPDLQKVALTIFEICVLNNISLYIHWIPREENQRADALSRIIDVDDWGISFEFFEFLNSMWGPFTIDRFANLSNTKLQRFNSLYWNPRTCAVDAFSCNWRGENNWLVPPVSLASKCINHLVSCRAMGTLVVPKWHSSAFWPLLFKQNLDYVSYVRDVLEFHESERIFVAGNNVNSLFANGNFHGKVIAVRLDASDM